MTISPNQHTPKKHLIKRIFFRAHDHHKLRVLTAPQKQWQLGLIARSLVKNAGTIVLVIGRAILATRTAISTGVMMDMTVTW